MTYTKTDEESSLLEPVLSVHSSDIVTSVKAASPGDRFLVTDSAGLEDGILVGSYPNTIKAGAARSQTNNTGTMGALSALNHTLYGLSLKEAGGTPYDNSSGFLWSEMVSFLSQSQDTNIKVFAMVAPRAQIASESVDRWGVQGGYHAGTWRFIEPHDSAARKYTAAAIELSNLSKTYPNLIGFTIDDFSSHNNNQLQNNYTCGDTADIVRGAKRWNKDFQFWPTHYVKDALVNAIPSTRIGFTYSFPTLANEYIGATHTFKLKTPLPTSASLEFLHSDTNDQAGHPNIKKYVWLNSQLVYSDSVQNDERVEVFSQEISAHLVTGSNEIRMYLSSSTDTNEYQKRVFSVGDIRILTNLAGDREISRQNGRIGEPVFDINGGNPLSASTAGHYNGRYMAETNEKYRYIAECPRALVVYGNHTGAIQARLPDIFASYRRTCPNTGILHTQQGFLFDDSIPAESIEQKFRSGSAHSDGLLVWNYPLYLQPTPVSGIFTQRTDTSTKYDIQTTFPRYQLAARGHYQRFTTKVAYGPATLYFKVAHAGGYPDYWLTAVGVSGSGTGSYGMADPPFYLNTTSSGGDAENSWATTHTITASLTSSTKIVFETNVNSAYGDSYTQVHFSGTAGGIHLSASAWDFDSDITGSAMTSLYTSVKDYYAEIVSAGTSYNNTIITRNNSGGWDVYVPSDGDRVYVAADKEERVYVASTETWDSLSRIAEKGLTVSGSLSVTKAVTRKGLFHASRDATASFDWTTTPQSASLSWDNYPRLDTDYYSASMDQVHIMESGDYKIAYGVSWYQTGAGAMVTGSLKTYIATSSFAAGSGSAANTSSIGTLPNSLNYGRIEGPQGGASRGSNSAAFMASLNTNDVLRLYVEHDYGHTPATTSTVERQAWIIIEKV